MSYLPTQRPRYFEGQYLEDSDFSQEQAYHIDRQRRHQRLLNVSGIAEGLNWEQPPAANTDIARVSFSVSAGTAIDLEGRTIVLSTPSPVTPITVPRDNVFNGDWILFIQYQETAIDPQDKTGTEIRISEAPRVDLIKPTFRRLTNN